MIVEKSLHLPSSYNEEINDDSRDRNVSTCTCTHINLLVRSIIINGNVHNKNDNYYHFERISHYVHVQYMYWYGGKYEKYMYVYMYVLVPKINADLKIFLTILLYFFLSLLLWILSLPPPPFPSQIFHRFPSHSRLFTVLVGNDVTISYNYVKINQWLIQSKFERT